MAVYGQTNNKKKVKTHEQAKYNNGNYTHFHCSIDSISNLPINKFIYYIYKQHPTAKATAVASQKCEQNNWFVLYNSLMQIPAFCASVHCLCVCSVYCIIYIVDIKLSPSHAISVVNAFTTRTIG